MTRITYQTLFMAYRLLMLSMWCFLLLFSSCKEQTNIDSTKITTKKERIQILSQETKVFSPIEDADYQLFNVNGFNSSPQSIFATPGATSYDYKFAVKLSSATDIEKWLRKDLVLIQNNVPPQQLLWVEDIVKHRKTNWQCTSKPIVFGMPTNGGFYTVLMLVYKDEKIIFKRVVAGS